MTVQYLESLDSVRTPVAEGADEATTSVAELQALLEVVLALALGRQVAVPYSYAFDSHVFLRIADAVLGARDDIRGSRDRPFLVHLHRFASFEAAISHMLERAGQPDDPFVSSLYPELSWSSEEERHELPTDVEDLLDTTDGGVADRLQGVRTEFRRRETRLSAPDGPGGSSLDAMVTHLARRADAPPALGDELRPAYDALVRAVRELRPDGFGQRSRLRRPDRPWPGDPRGRLLRDIVDADGLDLLTEFVDTYYNRVVFESMGQGAAAYSTTASASRGSAEARLVAQRLALGLDEQIGAGSVGQAPPVFDLLGDPGDVGRDSALQGLARRLLDGGSAALGPLMEARASGRQSDFWRGAAAVEDAARDRDARAFRRALDAHVDVVSRLMPTRVQMSVTGRQAAVAAGMNIGGAVAPPTAEALWTLPGGLAIGIAVLGVATPYVLHGGKRVQRRRERHSLKKALGDYVRGEGDR